MATARFLPGGSGRGFGTGTFNVDANGVRLAVGRHRHRLAAGRIRPTGGHDAGATHRSGDPCFLLRLEVRAT